jgi:hypothetical protein
VAGIISGAGLLAAGFGGGGEESLYLAAGGLFAGVIILFFTYRFFRHGSERVEGEFSSKKGAPTAGFDINEAVRAMQKGMRP